MEKMRFSDLGGKQYGDFTIAVPHYFNFEKLIGENVADLECVDELVDIGCGTMYTTRAVMAALGQRKYSIKAVDNEPTMIARAHEVVSDQRVIMHLENAIDFLGECADKSLNGIFSGFTIHNFDPEERATFFKEVRRVLRTRGRFVSADKYAYDNAINQTRSFSLQLSIMAEYYPEEVCQKWLDHYAADQLIAFTESEQREHLPSGVFVARHMMEAVFVWTKS